MTDVKLHDYQEDSINFALDNIKKDDILLAAAPNAGKTFMASYIIKHLINIGHRILCSVHGTNVLKRQFYDSIYPIIGDEYVSVYDTNELSLYDPAKPVQVMIYQNITQMEECVGLYGKFDYLVVDEAHKFYDDTLSMEKITKNFIKHKHLLLTGSPSVFKDKVDSGEIKAKYLSASLIEETTDQYDKDINLDIVANDIKLTNEDYNLNGEVSKKSNKKLLKNEDVLESLLVGNFGKTVVFVKRTKQADLIEEFLIKKNIKTLISHSKCDKSSENIKVFKEEYSGADNIVLIVVDRATEGFDDPNVSIIDLTYSKNIDTLYQRYSRAIRQRTDAINKRFVKVVPYDSSDVFVHIMTAVLMLLRQEHYENYNGKNFSILTIKQEVKKYKKGKVHHVKPFIPINEYKTDNIDDVVFIRSSDKPQSINDLILNDNFLVKVELDGVEYIIDDYDIWSKKLMGKKYTIIVNKVVNNNDSILMETKLYSGAFFDIKNEVYHHITKYATNVLRDVLYSEYYEDEETHLTYIIDNGIKCGSHYAKKYKESDLSLSSTPWIRFGTNSQKDYFEAIWGKKEYASEQEHINFIKDNNIVNSKIYNKLYKSSDLNLYANPWKKFSDSINTYFEAIWGNKEYANEQEHINFIKDNNIPHSKVYAKLYKKSELNLMANPWRKYGYSVTDYFESIWGKKANEQQHIDFIKINNIKSSTQYLELKTDNLYPSPWKKFGYGSITKYFKSIWGEDYSYESKETHIKFIKDNNIKSEKQYLKLYKDSELNLVSKPWRKYGQSVSNFFLSIWGERYSSKYQHKKFIIENNIKTTREYFELYKTSEHNLYSNPWKKFSNGAIRYFDDIWKEKDNNHLSDFSKLNKKWSKSNSKNIYKKLNKDTSEWYNYHKLYKESRKLWTEIPYVEIAKKINIRPDWVVADLGCGENLLAKEVKNKVYAFDYVAVDDSVIEADISNIPMEANSVDVVVISLALMGCNYIDYIKEAYRILKPYGNIFISEPYKKWENRGNELIKTLEGVGFKCFPIKYTNFLYVDGIKC